MLLVLKEMLPTYHKWRYNTYGVQERIGEPSVQPWCWHCVLSKAKKKKKKIKILINTFLQVVLFWS